MPTTQTDNALFEKQVAAAESAFNAVDGTPSVAEKWALSGTALGMLLFTSGFVISITLGRGDVLQYGFMLLVAVVVCGFFAGEMADNRQRRRISDLWKVSPDAVTQAATNVRTQRETKEQEREDRSRRKRLQRAGLTTPQ